MKIWSFNANKVSQKVILTWWTSCRTNTSGKFFFIITNGLLCFVHPIYHFWFLVTFGNEVKVVLEGCVSWHDPWVVITVITQGSAHTTFYTTLNKYYVIFVYILQGKMGKTEKNYATKVTKISKTKRHKYGMNQTFHMKFNWLVLEIKSI